MTKSTDDQLRAALLGELEAQLLPTEREPGEMTLAEMAQAKGVKRQAAERVMNKGMAEGLVERRQIIAAGKRVYVYRMKG